MIRLEQRLFASYIVVTSCLVCHMWEVLGLVVVLFCAGLANQCQATNVAQGKAVTLSGVFGSDLALAPTITDGVFLPKNTQWQNGTVWWNANLSPELPADIATRAILSDRSAVEAHERPFS